MKVILVDTSPFFCEKWTGAKSNGVVVLGCRTTAKLGCFPNWYHLEKTSWLPY